MSLGHGPNVVREGLVLLLDAKNPRSYSGTGTTYSNVATNTTIDWTITNASFNSDGYFTFNGTDAKIEYGSSIPGWNPDNSLTTLSVWFRPTTTPTANTPIFSDSYGPEYGIWYNTSNQIQYAAYASTVTSHSVNTWCCATLLVNSSTPNDGEITYRTAFLNDQLIVRNATATTSNGLNDTPYRLGNDVNVATSWFTGDIGPVMLYNRLLTDEEVFQNFQAFRGRFGL